MNKNVYIGEITHLVPVKGYGHIKFDEVDKAEYISFSIYDAQKKLKRRIAIGDKVKFLIVFSNQFGRNTANILEFVENSRIDEFLKLLPEDQIIVGYLKCVDNYYYIKELNTYLQFKVVDILGYIMPEVESIVRAKIKLNPKNVVKSLASLLDIERDENFAKLELRRYDTFKGQILSITDKYISVNLCDFNLVGYINRKNRDVTFNEGEIIFVWIVGIDSKIKLKTTL